MPFDTARARETPRATPRTQRLAPPELDELTLARAQRGDARAQQQLIERYQRPVFALLHRMLTRPGARTGDAVEDVAQEVFLKVLRALPSFDRAGPAKLSTWILTIASRRAIDELRRRQRALPVAEPRAGAADGVAHVEAIERAAMGGRAGAGGPDDPHDAAVHVGNAERALQRQQLATAIAAAVDALPPEFRAAFVLREFHDLDYPEIATALGIDLGTVKSRIHRAKARLRAALHEVRHDH
jgi:RNA polymerase sigma-70 factor (ECF subfamily)